MGKQWSDVQALEKRIGEYKDDLEIDMLQLRIPFELPQLLDIVAWSETKAEFQYLYHRINEVGQRAKNLNGAVATLASLTNNLQTFHAQEIALQAAERSLREARSVKTLTTLGAVFIPLTYIAAFFSMSGPYRPGERMFWMYFAAALPLTTLVLLGYNLMELGYADGGYAIVMPDNDNYYYGR